MRVIEAIRLLQAMPLDAELWVRVNIASSGCMDVVEKIYPDKDGDVVIEGEAGIEPGG